MQVFLNLLPMVIFSVVGLALLFSSLDYEWLDIGIQLISNHHHDLLSTSDLFYSSPSSPTFLFSYPAVLTSGLLGGNMFWGQMVKLFDSLLYEEIGK
jgi:hypothetical protein